jgi:hypothetical protein
MRGFAPKKKVNKNYKGQVPLSKQKIYTNQADLKKRSGGRPPIALGTPKLEWPREKNLTSLYGQSAPGHMQD